MTWNNKFMKMQREKNNLKYTAMRNFSIFLFFLGCSYTALMSQSMQRIKIDGVAAVVGKNIVLDSDIEKFKMELEQRSDSSVKVTDCEMLDKVMLQKHRKLNQINITAIFCYLLMPTV